MTKLKLICRTCGVEIESGGQCFICRAFAETIRESVQQSRQRRYRICSVLVIGGLAVVGWLVGDVLRGMAW